MLKANLCNEIRQHVSMKSGFVMFVVDSRMVVAGHHKHERTVDFDLCCEHVVPSDSLD